MSFDIPLTMARVGQNTFERTLIDHFGAPVMFENAIPQFPADLDIQLHRGSPGTPPAPNRISIGLEDEGSNCKVGIVSDVHQNSSVLAALLDRFTEESVSFLFCLGDYSFTKEPDTKGVRAKQFNKCMELIHQWVLGDDRREAVVLLGNHEIEDWYFGEEADGRASKEAVRRVLDTWRGAERLRFTRDPLASYELENAIDVTLYYGHSRRSFRLAHAVTKEFVTALYLGIDEAKLERSRQRITSNLGELWLNTQVALCNSVRTRWDAFVAAAPGSRERSNVVNEICSHMRSQMTTTAFLKSIPEGVEGAHSNAKQYLYEVMDTLRGSTYSRDSLSSFWGPPLHVTSEFMEVEFAYDLRRLYSALGIGRMYSLCGHFHADLGMFRASEEFGTHMIAVGGLQPRKIIGDSFTAYILDCGEEIDTLDRIETPDDQSIGEFDWDLTYPEWNIL